MLIRVIDILGLTFGLYKHHFGLFFKYIGLLFLPTFFIQLAGNVIQPLLLEKLNSDIWNAVISTAYLTLTIIAFLFELWITLALIRTTSDIYLKVPLKTVHDELGETRHYLWSALFVSILSTLAFAIWFLPLIISTGLEFSAVMQYLANPTNLAIFVLGLFPAIYFGLWYVFAVYNVVIDQEHDAIQAMKNAHRLVAPRWWAVLWRLAIPWMVFGLIAFIPKKLLTLTQAVAHNFIPFESAQYIFVMNLIAAIFIITGLFLTPLVIGAKTILYSELKKVPAKPTPPAVK